MDWNFHGKKMCLHISGGNASLLKRFLHGGSGGQPALTMALTPAPQVKRNLLNVSLRIAQYTDVISDLRREIERLKSKLETRETDKRSDPGGPDAQGRAEHGPAASVGCANPSPALCGCVPAPWAMGSARPSARCWVHSEHRHPGSRLPAWGLLSRHHLTV